MGKRSGQVGCTVTTLSLMFASTCLCSISAFGQQPTVDISGFWQFTGLAGPLASVQITQNEGKLAGQFVFSGTSTPVPFSGSISTLFGEAVNMDVQQDGEEVSFSGNIGSSSFMSGQYTIGSSRSGQNWIGTRLGAFGPPIITGITNAASASAGPIAPGEIISIYANATINPIGPSTGVGLEVDQAGEVSTTLGGVQVHFLPIDVYAPLTYVGAGQINAVVPYEVAGLVDGSVQVQYGEASNAFPVQVAATAPSIFTANGTGAGQGAILNQDGHLNGPDAPESRGGVVVLFVTGEGQTSPPGVSGKITTLSSTPPLTPMPTAAVSALINGQKAPVAFYGEAPGLVSGVMQINVQIPTTISSGNVPIQVFVGGKGSQSGVTVSVGQ